MPSDKEEEQLFQLLSTWSHESMVPLKVIEGYSALLLKEYVGERNNTQKDHIKIINTASIKAIKHLTNTWDYLKLQKWGTSNWKWEIASISKVIETIFLPVSYRYLKTDNVKINLSANLPLIKVDVPLLAKAIANLLEPDVCFQDFDPFQMEIKAFQTEGDTLHIAISSPFTCLLSENILEKTFQGSCINISNQIIQNLGGQLQYRYILPDNVTGNGGVSQGTIFEFDLPIWKEE